MPELPEVETITRRLATVLPGKIIERIEVTAPKSWRGPLPTLPTKIISVSRRAKHIKVLLEDGTFLVIHLKMTGQLLYQDADRRLGGGHPSPDWVAALPSKHTRCILYLNDDARLFFNDQRLFGWIWHMTVEELAHFEQKFGPEAHTDATVLYLQQKVAKSQQPIKVLMLDQTVLAGLGNIYVCDALHVAKINPQKPANRLSASEIHELCQAIRQTLLLGIEYQGTTFDGQYVDIDGMAGGYQKVARVYGKAGEPCIVCATPLEKYALRGRGTYWCPHCQM